MLCDGDRGGSGLTIVDNNYSGWFKGLILIWRSLSADYDLVSR